MVSTLFYIDPLDRPDLVPALAEAIGLVVGFGDWVIPAFIRQFEDGDIKAQMAIAHALGRIGANAIAPVLAEYQASTDATVRQFVPYTLSNASSGIAPITSVERPKRRCATCWRTHEGDARWPGPHDPRSAHFPGGGLAR